eukprot:gene10459-33260_t
MAVRGGSLAAVPGDSSVTIHAPVPLQARGGGERVGGASNKWCDAGAAGTPPDAAGSTRVSVQARRLGAVGIFLAPSNTRAPEARSPATEGSTHDLLAGDADGPVPLVVVGRLAAAARDIDGVDDAGAAAARSAAARIAAGAGVAARLVDRILAGPDAQPSAARDGGAGGAGRAAGADDDVDGADDDVEGADEDVEGADEDVEGADED